MSNLLWQYAIPGAGRDLTAAGPINSPNKVVLQNTSSRTIFVSCGVGISMPNLDDVGEFGTGYSSNCIALLPFTTSPTITIPSGGTLLAIVDSVNYIGSLNIFQES